jgi:hypothetical protein
LKRSGFWYSYNSVQETVDVGSNVRGIFTTNDGFYVLHDMGVKKYSLTLGLLSQSSSGLNSAIQGQGPRAIAVSENDVFISLITGNKIIKTDTGLTGVNATYTDTTQPSHVDVDAEGYPYVVDKITDGSRLFKLDKGLTTKLNVFEQYNGACSDVADFSVTVGKGSVYVTNIYCPYVTSIPTGTQTLYIYDGLNPIYEKTKIINATCLSYNNSCGTVQSGDCNNQGSGYCFFGEIVMNCVKCGGCSGEFRCQTNKNMTNYGSCYRPAAKPGKPVQVVEQNPPVV